MPFKNSTSICLGSPSVYSMINAFKKASVKRDFYKKIKTISKIFLQQYPLSPLVANLVKGCMISEKPIHNIHNIRYLIRDSEMQLKNFLGKKIKGNVLLFNPDSFLLNNLSASAKYIALKSDKKKCGGKCQIMEDLSLRSALKMADMALISPYSIGESKIYSRMGAELVAEAAKKQNIPVYVCGSYWMVDRKNVFKKWEKLESDALFFEKINPDLITGIISELGIFKHHIFMQELANTHPWI